MAERQDGAGVIEDVVVAWAGDNGVEMRSPVRAG